MAGRLNVQGPILHHHVPVVLRRPDGVAVIGASGLLGETTKSVVAGFQAVLFPAKSSDMQRLPENRREFRTLRGFSVTEVRTTNGDTGIGADEFDYVGQIWEVQLVEFWDWATSCYEFFAQVRRAP